VKPGGMLQASLPVTTTTITELLQRSDMTRGRLTTRFEPVITHLHCAERWANTSSDAKMLTRRIWFHHCFQAIMRCKHRFPPFFYKLIWHGKGNVHSQAKMQRVHPEKQGKHQRNKTGEWLKQNYLKALQQTS